MLPFVSEDGFTVMIYFQVITMTFARENKRNIEDVICSRIRLRILKALMHATLTPTEIARRIGSNYVIVREHLEVLRSENIVRQIRFGDRIKCYRFDENSPRAHAVQSFFETFESQSTDSG